jgi:hypothetical protein
VKCGDHHVEVTQNCVDALIHVRQKIGRLSIWVDAICIDQISVQERNHQVEIMGEIYSHAHTVYVWLGKPTLRSLGGIQLLRTAANKKICLQGLPCVYSPNWSRPDVLWSFLTSVAFPERSLLVRRKRCQLSLRRMGNFRVSLVDSQNIDFFLSQAWFQRGWTFQELILATNPIFLCGRESISWVDLVSAIIWICAEMPGSISAPCLPLRALVQVWMAIERPSQWNGKSTRRSINSSNSYRTYQQQFELLYERFIILRSIQHPVDLCMALARLPNHIRQNKGIHLKHLLPGIASAPSASEAYAELLMGTGIREFNGLMRALRERTVGNPKDKSYALYGVLQSLRIDLHPPDYNKPVSQVYRELFLDLLKWTPQSILLIVDAGHLDVEDSHVSAPSWVSRWDRPSNTNWLPDHYVYFREYGLSKPAWEIDDPRNDTFEALRSTLSLCNISRVSESKLFLDADLIDCVMHCVEFSPPVAVDIDSTLTFLNLIDECQERSVHGRIQQFFDDFYAALTMKESYDFNSRSNFPDKNSHGWCKWSEIMTSQPIELSDPTEQRSAITDMKSKWVDPSIHNAERVVKDLKKDAHAHIFHLQVCESLLDKRSLFVTKYGRIGTGQLSIRPGDSIYTISGVPTPVVLRDVRRKGEPDVFSFVGPAIVSPMWPSSIHQQNRHKNNILPERSRVTII